MSTHSQPRTAGERTRNRIVQAAAAAFRKHGFSGIGVRDVMKQAGLTQGSFYFHFKDKDELFVEASREAFGRTTALIFEAVDREPQERKLATLVSHYLSPEHRDTMEGGCTMAALGADAARLDWRTRRAFGQASDAMVSKVAGCFDDGQDGEEDRRRARLLAASMAGVLLASRVMASREDSDALLADARSSLIEQFGSSKKPRR